MVGRFPLSVALLAIGLTPLAAQGQSSRSVSFEQIGAPRAPAASNRATSNIGIAPVRGGSSSSSVTNEAPKQAATPAVPPEVIEACRAAQAEDRDPPEGVDCMAAMQALAQASAPSTAESSLLELFGQRGNVTGAPDVQSSASTNADTVARQVSTGEIQGNGAAAVVARERASPPPSSPR